MTKFAHLSLHTEFSIVDSVLRIDELVAACKRRGISAVAITDAGNLFGFWQFQKKLRQRGIKPLFGADFQVVNTTDSPPYRLIVLAQSSLGWANLRKLMSCAYTNFQSYSCITETDLFRYAEGLVVLSGGHQGQIGQLLIEGDHETAVLVANQYREQFGDRFYLEVTRTQRDHEAQYIEAVVRLADQLKLPLVATNDVRFLNTEDFASHETRYCIAHKKIIGDGTHELQYSDQQFFRTAKQMHKLFADMPDAIENANAIARRCTVEIPSTPHMPQFKSDCGSTPEELIDSKARVQLQKILKHYAETQQPVDAASYKERLESELEIIKEMGFAGYFLIVGDFVSWAKAQGIPVGPGRGSGSASLVALVLGIIDIDPIRHDLMFERLLNTERVSMPDFDIDFCMHRRGEVIDYVTQRYGRDRVAQIVSFNTFGSKTAVRDVTRVLGKPQGLGDRIARMIPIREVAPMPIADALNHVPELQTLAETDDEVAEILALAKNLEGLVKTTGKHAAGVVIAPDPLDEYVPVYTEKDGEEVLTQLDKNDVEDLGLVKFDFLGLKTVTAISEACKSVNQVHQKTNEAPLEILDVPLDDAKVYASLHEGHTTGIFQLESVGMRQKLKELHPTSLEDLIALEALFRPGPLDTGVTDQYIRRKNGRESVNYVHEKLKNVLGKTYGLMVYQEDVMNLARELAGFSMGHADVLRQAMGKKNEEVMVNLESEFFEGCEKNGVAARIAKQIYDDMRKFSRYAFNRAHAASYAVVAYQTAYLRHYYPAEYLAAIASCEVGTETILSYVEEAKRLGVQVVAPSVNESEYKFLGAEHRIVIGFCAIRQLEEKVAHQIVEQRKEGPYQSILDLCTRAQLHRRHRIPLERLIFVGALDCLHSDPTKSTGQIRAEFAGMIDTATHAAEQAAEREAANQADLFSGDDPDEVMIQLPKVDPWSQRTMLKNEHTALGFYVSGHPVEAYRDELQWLCTHNRLNTLQAELKSSKTGRVGGIVKEKKISETRSGNRYTRVILEDEVSTLTLNLFHENGDPSDDLVDGELAIATCFLHKDKGGTDVQLRTKSIQSIESARIERHAQLEVFVIESDDAPEFLHVLEGELTAVKAKGIPIILNFKNHQFTAKLRLGEDWRVVPSKDVIDNLSTSLGSDSIRLAYPNK